MKKTTRTLIFASLPVIIFSLFAPATLVSAQSGGGGGQALEIAPPVLNLTANPGQVIKSQISLRDVSTSKLIVQGQVNDFIADGEDGTPKLLLEDAEPSPYSLKSWIAPLPKLTMKPRQIENLPITIRVPANAAPGGYYGVIRFTATPPELEGQGVALSASLGALVLLKVNGTAKEELQIKEFFVSQGGKKATLFQTTPIQFTERINNVGNVHEQPSGQVVITDMFGKKVAAVNINLPPRNILPQSIRKFEQNLDTSVIGNKQLFGRYTATLNITYGDKKQTVSSTTTFWVIPWMLIVLIIAALVVGFIALRIMIKRYNKHIIGKATKKSRKK